MTRLNVRIKDPFCGVSHFIGAALSVAALATLALRSWGRTVPLISFAIYGVSSIFLYTASTLYHSFDLPPQRQRWLRKFDYIGIFLLISGSYAPICLLPLRNTVGPQLLAAVYGIALIGIVSLIVWKRAPNGVHVVLFAIMGWLGALAFPALRAAVPLATLNWLIAGGVTYTIGLIVYATKWPNLWPGRFNSHDLWHCFVLGGGACHFVMMLRLAAVA